MTKLIKLGRDNNICKVIKTIYYYWRYDKLSEM